MAIDLTQFITQALSPALVLSAIGILISDMHSRLITVAGRVRELNAELRNGPTPKRLASIQQQEGLFLERTNLISKALFILYSAMGLMVFTAIAIALQELHWIARSFMIPVWSFLSGLLMVFTAVVVEAGSIDINKQLLEIDIEGSRPD